MGGAAVLFEALELLAHGCCDAGAPDWLGIVLALVVGAAALVVLWGLWWPRG